MFNFLGIRAVRARANARLRQWRELIQPISSYAIPNTLVEAKERIRHNVFYFFPSYSIFTRSIFFLRQLLWNPESNMILPTIIFLVWLLTYFCCGNRRTFCVRLVLDFTAVLCIFVFPWDTLASLLIGLAIVAVHATFKGT